MTESVMEKPLRTFQAKGRAAVRFVGVGLGTILVAGEESEHGGDHGGQHAMADHGTPHDAESHGDDHASGSVGGELSVVKSEGALEPETRLYERLLMDKANSGIADEVEARVAQRELARGEIVSDPSEVSGGIYEVQGSVLTPRTAGIFFSIYYCMTGIHAIHILAGIGVLVWLLIRAVRQDFNRQYFGPVDYVGLYWHLVDLIWIYLFPLLYLIR